MVSAGTVQWKKKKRKKNRDDRRMELLQKRTKQNRKQGCAVLCLVYLLILRFSLFIRYRLVHLIPVRPFGKPWLMQNLFAQYGIHLSLAQMNRLPKDHCNSHTGSIFRLFRPSSYFMECSHSRLISFTNKVFENILSERRSFRLFPFQNQMIIYYSRFGTSVHHSLFESFSEVIIRNHT